MQWRCTTLVIALALVESSGALPAQSPRRKAVLYADSANEVPRVRISSKVVRLPVIPGSDIRFTHLTTAEGLSQMKVSQILQDDRGFMWFGTQYGLNRYDGYRFKAFVREPENPRSLSGVFVGALFKDRSGILWVACGQLLNRFDPATESFTQYSVPFVNHISEDASHTLWLATGKGLYSLNPSTGEVRGFSHDPSNARSLSSNDVKSSGEDKSGNFWVATGEGLDEFDRNTGRVKLHVPLREPLREFSFYEDRFGTFWIFHASSDGLAVFDRKTNTLIPYSFYKHEPARTAVAGARTILEDTSGDLWIGTDRAGLLRFDRQNQRFIAYRHDPADPTSLAEDTVTDLFEDREGNIWASLGGRGIERFSSKPLLFTILPYTAPSKKGVSIVSAVYQDRKGSLWIATRDIVNQIYPSGRHSVYPIADVISIIEDHAGALWLGTFNHGLYRLDRNTGRFKIYRHNSADNHSLSSDIVSRMVVDHDGTLWAATWDGLNRFDANSERFAVYQFDPQDKNLFYLELTEGPDGLLWLGTHAAGVQSFDPKSGQFVEYNKNSHRPIFLSDSRVNSVHFDRPGTMWVGTQNGLDKVDPSTGTPAIYTERDGLSGNAIGCVLEDSYGNLWMSTNKGVARFNPTTKVFTNLSTADGLPGSDLTGSGACFASATGEMFFGGFGGGISFYPDKLRDGSDIPVVFTNFRLSGKPVDIGSGSPLKKSITYAESVVLRHDQRMFSLEFAALDYSNPQAIRYRYKLDGLDKDWNEAGSDQRIVNYTSLAAGRYKFEVQARSGRGVWSRSVATLAIEILPPWWSTWWFRVGCVIAVVALLWGIHRWRIRQLQQKFASMLDARVNERTRIARDLHDTLLQSLHGLLLSFQRAANLLPDRPVEAKQRLEGAIDQAARAITEGRDAVQGLRSSTVATNDLPVAIQTLGEELAAKEGKQPVFDVAVEGAQRDLNPILRDEVYRIAGEAVRNAFQHAQARRVEVEVHYDDRQLRVRIRDDGKGVDAEILSNKGRSGHWGLPGMRERAKLVGGQLELWSQLDSGTEIELTIPASIAYVSCASRPSKRRTA